LQCSQDDVNGSKVYKSLKQKACGPLPPNKNKLSSTLQSSIPALGAGLSPTTYIYDHMKSFRLKINKSLRRFDPSQPPNIYRLLFIILEL
jgi:hypothetical protein